MRALGLLEPAKPNAATETPSPFREQTMAAAAAGDVGEAFDLFFRSVCGPDVRELVRARLGEQGLPQAMRDAAFFFQDELPAAIDWQLDPGAARAVRQPALLATLLADTEHRTLAGVGHAMPLEDPAAVARTVAEFLTRHPM